MTVRQLASKQKHECEIDDKPGKGQGPIENSNLAAASCINVPVSKEEKSGGCK